MSREEYLGRDNLNMSLKDIVDALIGRFLQDQPSREKIEELGDYFHYRADSIYESMGPV